MYLAVTGHADILTHCQEVVGTGHLNRTFGSTDTERANVFRQDSGQEVQSVVVVCTIGHKLYRHLLARTHQTAYVLSDAIRCTEEDIAIAVAALGMGIGQLGCRFLVTVINRHVIDRLAIAECLGRDGSRQADDAAFRSHQREFAVVVDTVGLDGAAGIIDLEEDGV